MDNTRYASCSRPCSSPVRASYAPTPRKGSACSSGTPSRSSQAARVGLIAGKVKVTDGLFTESKEVIGGFFVLEVKDKAAAVEMTRRFVEDHKQALGEDFQLECEVRQLDG